MTFPKMSVRVFDLRHKNLVSRQSKFVPQHSLPPTLQQSFLHHSPSSILNAPLPETRLPLLPRRPHLHLHNPLPPHPPSSNSSSPNPPPCSPPNLHPPLLSPPPPHNLLARPLPSLYPFSRVRLAFGEICFTDDDLLTASAVCVQCGRGRG